MKLNDIMDFDLVVEVDERGRVTERPDIYAPNLYGEALDDESWSLMNGYSGQDRYSGPIMHPSEFIGGGMERDILGTPGLYVAIVSYDIDDDSDDNVLGWAVAYQAWEDE